MDRTRTTIVAAALAAVAGCAGMVPVKKNTTTAEAAEKAPAIAAGQTTQAEVRAVLGKPWLESARWQFDLFRVTGRDVSAPFMFVLWWPVPLGVAIDKTTAYVLVAYDAESRVTSAERAFSYDHSFFSNFFGEEGRQGGTDVGVQMTSGDLAFSADYKDESFLSVEAGRRDDYLAQPHPDRCRMLLGCEDEWCPLQVDVDGREVAVLPDWLSTFHHALEPLDLKPGAHRLAIRPTRTSWSFEAASDFSCQAGETLYALVRLEPREYKLMRTLMDASISIAPEMPEAFRDRRLLIWGKGRWLVSAEPGT